MGKRTWCTLGAWLISAGLATAQTARPVERTGYSTPVELPVALVVSQSRPPGIDQLPVPKVVSQPPEGPAGAPLPKIVDQTPVIIEMAQPARP